MRRAHLIFPMMLLAALPAAAQPDNWSIDFEARYWGPDVSGDLRVVEGGLGTTVGLTDDLGLQDDEFLEGRLVLKTSRRSWLRVGWVPIQYHGDEVVSRTIEFNGQTFGISARVVSDLDLDYARLGWAWQFLSTTDGSFRLGPLLEVKAFRGDATLAAPDLADPIKESQSFEAAFGSVGAALDAEVSRRVSIFGELSVLVATDQGDLTDAEAGARFQATPHLTIVGGYRSLDVNAQDGDDNFDFKLEGPFVGVSFRN